MKKVLIADDELLVRIGLKLTIPWEKNNFVVVGEAKNGREAIELFEKYNPDILLTDIRMPIMNGLELIQELKTRKRSLKAVILTHYDDFGYAKEAIKLGASEYILKSDLSEENLLSVLNKLSEEIVPIDDNKVLNEKGPSTDKTWNHFGAETLLKRLVSADYKSQQELEEIINNSRAFLKYGFFVIASAKVYYNDISIAEQSLAREGLKKSFENVSTQVFDEHQISQISCFNDDEMVYLFNIEDTRNAVKDSERLHDQIFLLRKNIMQFLDIDLYIGISSTAERCEKIPQLLEEARAAQNDCFFEPMGIAYFNAGKAAYVGESPKVNLETLRSYIKTFDIDKLDTYISGVFEKVAKLRNITCEKEVFIDFLSYAKVIAAELGLSNLPAFNENKMSYGNFERLHNFEAAKKYIMDLYHELIKGTDESKSTRYSFVIGKCVDYIRNNYQKNISLADAAEHVQISKSYLSLLFKQETGINFSNFLTNYRIEKSKKLLKESNYKIYEIAEKVGFDNPYYFSKVFKDVTGISCKEFKKDNV